MNWLKGFLEQKTDLLVPFAPTQENKQQCASKWDKSLVPDLSQTCPKEMDPTSLLVEPRTLGQNFKTLGQKFEADLSHLKRIPSLALSSLGTNGTSGTSLFGDALDLWEERSAIIEYEAGYPRPEAEARALAELQPSTGKGGCMTHSLSISQRITLSWMPSPAWNAKDSLLVSCVGPLFGRSRVLR